MTDHIDDFSKRFLDDRGVDLFKRFNGWHRAVVEETNDPLQFRRVKVRIPELHNSDTKVEELPWALPAPWMGGINSGSWTHPIIKDQVFVCFEKNHPYVPIWCAASDPTRRRMYSMWSMYTKSPQAVNALGDPADTPKEYLDDFLPKDFRPMSTGHSDRYGNFFFMSSYGFIPVEHKISPSPVGVDAISKNAFDNGVQPVSNDPDLKYLTFGTKYGHFMILGDQGYNWEEEFKGDFESDKEFEQDRYQYLLKLFNEQQPKEHDQRRIELRTRMGHKLEMRDVGWSKSRPGEFSDSKNIAESNGVDERWIKLRTKGGHIIQLLDKGFDQAQDVFYTRLNQTEYSTIDDEDDLGDDQRLIRLRTRHGNQLILDDRGSDPIDAKSKEDPHGNGFLLRTRKGYQIQAIDKLEMDHFMMVSPKNQVIEINDRFQYVLMSTPQSGRLSTDAFSKDLYSNKNGQTYDPASNTHHLILDKLNGMVRLKNPNDAGIEVRDGESPCGEWLEIRDKENRALWMSAKDNILLLRDKPGYKYILLDDKDDVILIKNENGKIQIRAKSKIEIKCDDGDINLEATNGEIGLKSKKITISSGGSESIFDGQGFGCTKLIQGAQLDGTHLQIDKPLHSAGRASPNGRGESPKPVADKNITRKKPEDFDKERGCDQFKDDKGEIPNEVYTGGPGNGNGSGLPNGQPAFSAPGASNTAPQSPGANVPISSDPITNPIEELDPSSGGVLWYGISNRFLDELAEHGLTLNSYMNILNVPPFMDADQLYLARNLSYAVDQAKLSQKRYGDGYTILRIRNVPDPDLLKIIDGDIMSYDGNIPYDNDMTYVEIYRTNHSELISAPIYDLD